MTEQSTSYVLAITPTARRQLTDNLPEAVAAAAYEFIIGPLLDNRTGSASSFVPRWRAGTACAAAPTGSSPASTTTSTR